MRTFQTEDGSVHVAVQIRDEDMHTKGPCSMCSLARANCGYATCASTKDGFTVIYMEVV